MFNQLVESTTHRADLKRKGTFFLGAFFFYAMLLTTAGIGSIYAYNVHLDDVNEEMTTILISPKDLPTDAPRPEPRRPVNSGTGRQNHPAERPEAIARLLQNTKPPETISLIPHSLPELPPGPVIFTNRVFDPSSDGGAVAGPTGPSGSPASSAGSGTQLVVEEAGDETPPPPAPTPKPPPQKVRLTSSMISAKALDKPAPAYPQIAKITRTQGPVAVEIVIDEEGHVISAHATNGPQVLRIAAQQAALQARFSPTKLNGQPVKVTGVITYNFVLQ